MQHSHAVLVVEGQLVYGDSTAKVLFTLPKGATPLRVSVFTQSTSTNATCSIGTAADTSKYVSALSVATAQVNVATLLDATKLTVATDIYGAIGGSPGSGGPFTVFMEYTYDRLPVA